MAEWTIATVLKTVVGASSPGVRIPLPPLAGFSAESLFLTMLIFRGTVIGEVPEWTIGAAC